MDLVEADFKPPYLDTDQWPITHHVEILTINPNDAPDANTGLRPPTVTMVQRTRDFNANLQKELLSESKQDSKIKSQEFSKFLVDKKAVKIQTAAILATLRIFHGHLARSKCTGFLFKFTFTITPTMI